MLYCTACAVTLETFQKTTYFPFAYSIPFRKYGYNIRHFFTILVQVHIIGIQVNILSIFKAYSRLM